MQLSDLSPDERLALVALMKAVVMADGGVSEEEVAEIGEIVDEIGEETYQKLCDEVDERFKSEASLKKFLTATGNEESRNLIYGIVLDAAMSETLQGQEPELLNWLAKTWKVEVSLEGGPLLDED